jgi:hypothetical protein
MPILKVSHSGVTVSNPPINPSGGGPRGEVAGWSIKSARRCEAFLRSILFEELDERGLTGFACTFTIRNLPETHRDWNRMIMALRKRLERRGMACGHYVTEWQMRGRFSSEAVPHLHMILFFPIERPPSYERCYPEDALRCFWLDVADPYFPELSGQNVKSVSDLVGWFRYLSKHASRGVHHYQRSAGAIPAGWLKTGRMWGTWGEWPIFTFEGRISTALFYALRRFTTRYQLASARSDLKRSYERYSGAWNEQQRQEALKHIKTSRKRLRYLKRRLQAPENFARIVPVSDWTPADVITHWLDHVAYRGECVDWATGEILLEYWLESEDWDGTQA